MKLLVVIFAFSASLAQAESINFQPGLNLYGEVATLTDLMGANGNQLCGPISATHLFNYLKYSHAPPFSSLLAFPDMDNDGVVNSYRDQVRYFFQTCKTDRVQGTHYQDLVACMRDYMNQSQVGTWAYMIGPHAIEAPPNSTLESVQHVIDPSYVRYFVSNHAGVIMTVGWYRLNADGLTYSRVGGHIFNVYGYDYQDADGLQKITLDVVSSFTDYGARSADQMFDAVSMTALPADGTQYPVETGYQIQGTGFNFNEKALVEDLIVAFPVTAGAQLIAP
jgi:hypothetical protein